MEQAVITKQERVYFTSPIPQSFRPEEPVQMLVTRQMYKHHDIQIGDIVEVTNPHIDRRQLWFTTVDGGRTVQGHVLGHPEKMRESRQIGIFSDDLFAYFILNDHQDGVTRGHVSRWSNPDLPTSIGGDYGLFPQAVPAAAWARDLMPFPGDSEEMVRAKVERAKHKWERMYKALRILDQSDDRGWGHHIETLRQEWHDAIPVRRYDVMATGRALITVPGTPAPELVESARRRVENNGGTFAEEQLVSTQYVALEVPNLEVAANLPESELGDRINTLFTNQLRNKFGDYSLQGVLTSYDSVLRSATY